MPSGPIIEARRLPTMRSPQPETETHQMQYDLAKARGHFAAKQSFTTGPHELVGMIDRKEDIVIVDVRFPSDFRKGHVPGAINLPKGKRHEATGLAKDKLNVLYC